MQSKLWFFLICKMLYECVKRSKKGPKQIPKKRPTNGQTRKDPNLGQKGQNRLLKKG